MSQKLYGLMVGDPYELRLAESYISQIFDLFARLDEEPNVKAEIRETLDRLGRNRDRVMDDVLSGKYDKDGKAIGHYISSPLATWEGEIDTYKPEVGIDREDLELTCEGMGTRINKWVQKIKNLEDHNKLERGSLLEETTQCLVNTSD